MYRRYYSYNDMPQIAVRNEKKTEEVHKCEEQEKCTDKNAADNKLFGKFELDDIILAVIILVLLMDDGDDTVLLIALAAVFLTGLI
ncbi:MAG: hypothetical protein J6C82_01395 [Clostridia bacterium]|nr:hypothetical protein [Clostridia bacterium]